MKTKNKWGGTRTGAGAKLKYGEPTKRLTFSVPESKIEEVKQTVKTILKTAGL